MNRTARLVLAATATLMLALPTAAQAVNTKVEISDGLRVTQRLETTFAHPNNISLRIQGPSSAEVIIVRDTGGATLEPGNGCSTLSTTEISCPNPFTGKIRIYTGPGNDTIDLSGLAGKFVQPEVHGGAGNDTITGSPDGDTLFGDGNHGNGAPPLPNNPDDTPNGNDTLVGGPGNDTLFGGPDRDYLLGSAVAGGSVTETNVLDGGDGRDVFDLGPSLGADEVRAGEADEGTTAANLPVLSSLAPGLGGIHVDGDIASYERRVFTVSGTVGITADLDAVADDGAPGEGDVLGNVESISGSPRDDTLTGNGEDNVLIGSLGKDKLIGAAANDRLRLIDGIADDCPDGGTGTNDISADLADQPVIEACTPPPASPPPPVPNSFTKLKVNSLLFTPVDETTKPAAIGFKLKRSGAKLSVKLKCPRSQPACTGTLSIAPLKGGASVARVSYRVPVKASSSVKLPVGPKKLAKLRRSGGAELTLVHMGKSTKGVTTVKVARRVPTD